MAHQEYFLEQKILVLSYYDNPMFEIDTAEHILGYYSSEELIEQQKKRLCDIGLKTELHVTKRSLKALVEGAKKLLAIENLSYEELGELGYDECNLGYGEECIEGHNWEYPWAEVYDSPDEIFSLLDDNSKIDRFIQGFEDWKKGIYPKKKSGLKRT